MAIIDWWWNIIPWYSHKTWISHKISSIFHGNDPSIFTYHLHSDTPLTTIRHPWASTWARKAMVTWAAGSAEPTKHFSHPLFSPEMSGINSNGWGWYIVYTLMVFPKFWAIALGWQEMSSATLMLRNVECPWRHAKDAAHHEIDDAPGGLTGFVLFLLYLTIVSGGQRDVRKKYPHADGNCIFLYVSIFLYIVCRYKYKYICIYIFSTILYYPILSYPILHNTILC